MTLIAITSLAFFGNVLYTAYKRNALLAPDCEFGGWIVKDLGP